LVELAHDSAGQVVAAAADAGCRKVAGVANHFVEILGLVRYSGVTASYLDPLNPFSQIFHKNGFMSHQ
jgi:hypothetical protein